MMLDTILNLLTFFNQLVTSYMLFLIIKTMKHYYPIYSNSKRDKIFNNFIKENFKILEKEDDENKESINFVYAVYCTWHETMYRGKQISKNKFIECINRSNMIHDTNDIKNIEYNNSGLG
jgi:hypothetical protein